MNTMTNELLSNAIDRLYPTGPVRDKILQSLWVPQVGDHHNEGPFMEAHVARMLKVLEDLQNGTFNPNTPPAAQEAIVRALRDDGGPDHARKFCLVHDIAKMDCMTLVSSKGSAPVTWPQWVAMVGTPYPTKEELDKALKTHGVTKIQYFQELPGEKEPHRHGEVGANWLQEHGEMDPVLLHTVAHHEVTMSYNRLLVDAWRRHYGHLSSSIQDFTLLANYLDAMGSLNIDGKPDFGEFSNMARSWETSKALKMAEEAMKPVPGLDKNRLNRELASAKADYLRLEDVPVFVGALKARCVATYDVTTLRLGMVPLIANGTISLEESDQLVDFLKSSPEGLSAVGRVFGPRMRHIRPVIDAARK